MGRASILAFLLSLACIGARAAAVPPMQDQAHFGEAVESFSPAPYFVLVTVIDDTTQKSWTGCMPANLLKGAVHFEHGLDYDEAGVSQTREILLAAKDHVYHFSNPRALANIPMDAYGTDDLAQARAYLQAHGTAFLLSDDWDKIDAANKLNRTALACAIIERGLAARMSDGRGETYAEP